MAKIFIFLDTLGCESIQSLQFLYLPYSLLVSHKSTIHLSIFQQLAIHR
nr:MAG TPA: hypothetical protein [Caudoviricetes sp.]DAK65351.1 MAG TPA: hypothetical protein [Caudoviricetes sp.]DAQ80454.1 MAG TPA: hypothetical protein [Herelleviridae sp.]